MKKNGRRNGVQRYKCLARSHQFQSQRHTNAQKLWHTYTHGKQTYAQIAAQEKLSVRWVQKLIDRVELRQEILLPRSVVIVMDTTYFRRTFGVMVVRCPHQKQNIFWEFVAYETVERYVSLVQKLRQHGWYIQAIVCDGRRGLFTAFPGIPVQMCHFHQAQIVTRYVTRRPKLAAGIELQSLMRLLPRTDEASFTHWLSAWHRRWKGFLADRTIDPVTGHWHYTHRRLRSAYRSVRSNLPYLFTFEYHPRLNIPNTTNSLDGTFAHIKDKLRLHRGLKLHRKQKLIEELLRS